MYEEKAMTSSLSVFSLAGRGLFLWRPAAWFRGDSVLYFPQARTDWLGGGGG
jgi:hypothetical protein